MRTNVPEKLIKIGDDIQDSGSTSLTRLTVLKKWFEQNPKRLRSFSIFIANRASTRKGKTAGEAAELFHEARLLLKSADIFEPRISPEAAETLYRQLKDFQSEYHEQQWGPVRIINNRNLLLVEEGLRIFRGSACDPSNGYRLAAKYCENYDPKYGNGLNGPSLTKLNEIVRFMFNIEAREDLQT